MPTTAPNEHTNIRIYAYVHLFISM